MIFSEAVEYLVQSVERLFNVGGPNIAHVADPYSAFFIATDAPRDQDAPRFEPVPDYHRIELRRNANSCEGGRATLLVWALKR